MSGIIITSDEYQPLSFLKGKLSKHIFKIVMRYYPLDTKIKVCKYFECDQYIYSKYIYCQFCRMCFMEDGYSLCKRCGELSFDCFCRSKIYRCDYPTCSGKCWYCKKYDIV